jgi:cob(I)alamin adenosyltransferase
MAEQDFPPITPGRGRLTYDKETRTIVSDINSAKSTIADKIHEAVSSLLNTEQRLNAELNEARQIARDLKADLEQLQQQFITEQDVRRALENKLSKIAEILR